MIKTNTKNMSPLMKTHYREGAMAYIDRFIVCPVTGQPLSAYEGFAIIGLQPMTEEYEQDGLKDVAVLLHKSANVDKVIEVIEDTRQPEATVVSPELLDLSTL